MDVDAVESWQCGKLETYRSRGGRFWVVAAAARDTTVLCSACLLVVNTLQHLLVFLWTDRCDVNLPLGCSLSMLMILLKLTVQLIVKRHSVLLS